MKIDSVVRGCLIAFVFLLAMLVFRTSVPVKASPTTQWHVVDISASGGAGYYENVLNTAQAQGWQYVGSAPPSLLIFKK